MSATKTRLSSVVELDTDAVSPDSLKAAFACAVDSLVSRADRNIVALNWNSIETVLHRISDADTNLVVRVAAL